jgi:hypothetical protein
MKPNAKQSLERILESAIVVSWADLMRGAHTGLVHLEYASLQAALWIICRSGRP